MYYPDSSVCTSFVLKIVATLCCWECCLFGLDIYGFVLYTVLSLKWVLTSIVVPRAFFCFLFRHVVFRNSVWVLLIYFSLLFGVNFCYFMS